MAQPALVSMAQQFTGLPMDDLIGGPLTAAAKANSMMAMTQTKFMLDTCFSLGDDGNYTPLMITMQLTRGVLTPGEPSETEKEADPKIIPVTTKFDLPLLTIIPLNSLGVDNVDVEFDMEVKSSYSEDTSSKTESKLAAEATLAGKLRYGLISASIKGSVSYDLTKSSSKDTHYEKSNSAHYSIKVHAGQLPLPSGVTTILDAFAKSIQPIEMPTTE